MKDAKTRKIGKLMVWLLVIAMLLPMVPAVQVSAEEEQTVTELPTVTLPGDTIQGDQEIPTIRQWNFSDTADLDAFDVYTSGSSEFVVQDGVLFANGTDSEQKAILKEELSVVKTVSVNILPGESGSIYGGVYVGAKNAQAGQDQIQSMVVFVKSDYTGWSDAPNRIDLVLGEFNNNWKQLDSVISETGNGNNLFTGGNKEPLNLKLSFSRDCILATLSLVSNPAKYIQKIFTVEPEKLQGKVGLRSLASDTKYDRFTVNEDYIPESLNSGLKLDGTGKDSYARTLSTLSEKPVTIEAWVRMDKRETSGRQAIISNYTGSSLASNSQGTWGLYTDEDGDIWYTERCGGTTYNNTERLEMWTGEWTHVTIVRSQGVLKTYANGELVNARENAIMGESNVLDNYLTIGFCSVGSGSMKGEIGDIRLWSTERTQAQIQANMYRELTGTEEGLIQHWNFDSQDKGIVKNTVQGGVDLELLGHTQIGNEEIRRWDFSEESQLEDFTFYYSTESANVYNFSLKNGALFTSGSINTSSQDVKAMLNEEIDDILYIGADVTQGGTSTANTGMVLGVKSINSAELNDYEGFHVYLTRYRTSAARRPWAEAYFRKISGGTSTTLTEQACNETFFPGADVKLPFHIQVEFDGNKADALMYRLDDPTITVGQTYTFADGDLDGQIGLWLGKTSVYYDNYTIVSKAPETVAPPAIEDTVLYDNQGYAFGTDSQAWRLNKNLEDTPYTVEAWVKIPEGVADSATGYIVSNANRAPYISMQMIAGGDLRLSWGVEDAGLAIVNKNFDVPTELRNGKWTHVAYTCDVANDTVVAYINGKVMCTWENAGLVDFDLPDHITPHNLFSVGSLSVANSSTNELDPSDSLLGWVADVRMWNKPLTAAQVQQSMMTQYTQAHEGLIVNLPLNEKVNDSFADLSGNGYDAKVISVKMTFEEQTHEPGAYSMIVIPDQQILAHYYEPELYGLYQWIADNREKENIQMVMSVGDLNDNCGNLDQWQRNQNAWKLLPEDLPYIVAPGNHDYDTNSGWNKGYGVREQLTLMNQYFPQSIFENYPTEIGFFDEVNSANQWQAFAVNGNHYLVMALEYVPQDDVLAWANEVVEAHPHHQVIMVTHSYVGSYGELDVPKVWSQFLSKHENIIMAFSGHVWSTAAVRRTDTGINGNQVHQVLMDAQMSDTGNKKVAMVGILRFNVDGTVCDVSYLSTSKGQYEVNSNFTLQLPTPNELVAQVGDRVYGSVNEAVSAANGEMVTILADTEEEIVIEQNATIDLAGHTLTNVTVSEGATLYGVDTTTDGYDCTDGYGKITNLTGSFAVHHKTVVDGNPQRYLAVTEEDGVSFHRFYIGIQYITLKPAAVGFGYKAIYGGDEKVQASLKEEGAFGYNLWVTEDKVVTVGSNADAFVTGSSGTPRTLSLNNFDTVNYGEAPVYATVYITLADGTTITSAEYSYSMRTMVERVNKDYAKYSDVQLRAAARMILKDTTMPSWEVENILDALKPKASMESLLVVDESMTVIGGQSTSLTLTGAAQFTAQDTPETLTDNPYGDWITDFYVSMDKEAGEGLLLAGNYGDSGWTALPLTDGQTDIALLQALLDQSLTYTEFVTQGASFCCGVADTLSQNTGATVTVELRLTNPQDPADYIVAGQTSVYLDSAVSAEYEAVSGGVTAEDGVITATAAGTLVLHETRGLANGTYFAEISTTDNTRPAGIVFGASQDGSSYYLFRLGNGSKVELVKVANGTETVVDTGFYPANRRKEYNGMEIVVDGDTIHGYVHNPHYPKIHCFAVHEESTFAGNRIGLWSGAEGVTFRNGELSASTETRTAQVLLFGHSYTEMWNDYASFFPEYPDIDNVGLGGSVASQWEQFPEELASYEPELGIFMIGINDLTGSVTPKAVVDSMENTLVQIKALVPEFEVVVTAVNHCPNRATITDKISQCNALMRNLAASYDWIYYAETEYALCTDPSDPLTADASLFSDGLHPNAAGYAILVEAIRSAAKGENQPTLDGELAQAQMAEAKAAKLASLNIYGETAYTEENWELAQPYYNAALAKIDSCTTERQLKDLDLTAELAALDAIENKAAGIVSNIFDPTTSDVRSTIKWTKLDSYTVNATDYVYALDKTVTYGDSEAVFKLSNPSAGVGTAGLLLRGRKAANLGMFGYLVNVNTNGNYIQIYYLNNSYNNDSSATVTKYIGGIVLNNYGIDAVDTEFYAKIEGDQLYVNTLQRHLAGQANLATIDLTNAGAYEVYEAGHTGILSWTTSSFDFHLKRYAGEAIDTNFADEILTNLLNTETCISRGNIDWTKVDDYTVHANGLNYALDSTAVYGDSEAVVKLSNASANIGTAGLLLRATVTEGKGIQGYLFNINTNSNYIQIYHLNNNYNTDGSTATLTYVGGIVLNNYNINALDTEFWLRIEDDKLYINTVERQAAGTKVLGTVDLTKGGQVEVYESGYTGVLSWASGVSFDFQVKEFSEI